MSMMYGLGLGLGGPIAGIAMIALVGLVVWFIVGAVRPDRTVDANAPSRALEVLADRYARGEIDAETYRTTRATIQGAR